MGFSENDPSIIEARRRGMIEDKTPARGIPVPVDPTPGEAAAAEVVAWCTERGWEVPVAEHRFAPPRRWRFDLAWPGKLIAVEFQGGIWCMGRHNRPKGFAADCEKFSTAASLGWRVMPVTYAQFKNGMLLAWVERVMGT